MVELTAFRFHPGHARLHRLDVRFKLAALAVVSFSAINAGFEGAAALGALLVVTAVCTRLPLLAVVREVRFFLLFLGLIWFVRALNGPKTEGFGLAGYVLSLQGMREGGLICLRLLVVMLAGWLLVATTRTFDIKAAVQWFLGPVPGIPAAKVAVMLGLVVRFMPLIFDQAQHITLAQKARAVQQRKNPFYRLKNFTLPLIRRIFEDADRLALAMQARGFGENRTDPVLTATSGDWIFLSGVTLFCMLILSMRFVFN